MSNLGRKLNMQELGKQHIQRHALRIHNLLFVRCFLRVYPLEDIVYNKALANTAMTVIWGFELERKNEEIKERRTKLDSFIDFTNPLKLIRMSVMMRTIFLSYQYDGNKGPIFSKESVNTWLLKHWI
jgi:hypothetical protein